MTDAPRIRPVGSDEPRNRGRRAGTEAATAQATGKANIVDVVNSVNSAELTLDTVVAVRDKVVQAYQSIMNMPI